MRSWLSDDPAFQAEYEAARCAPFRAAINRIPALAARAVDTLAALLGEGEPPAVRLGAARTVAEIGLYQHDAETILKKLDAIEARQPQRCKRPSIIGMRRTSRLLRSSSGQRVRSSPSMFDTSNATTAERQVP